MRFTDIDLVSLRRIAEVASRNEAFLMRTAGNGLESTVRLCEIAAEMPPNIHGLDAVKAGAVAQLQRSWTSLLDVAGQPSRPLPTRSMGDCRGRVRAQ